MDRYILVGLIAFMISVASGCNMLTPVPSATSFPASSTFSYARPDDVGLSCCKVESLAGRVHKWVKQGKIVGAEVIVIKNDKIVLHDALGWSDREGRIPLERNSIYRIRSMTKPFIGTAVLILAEEGRLSLDDTVARYIQSFDNERSGGITIHQLLTHTAGYVQGVYPSDYWNAPTLREAVDKIGRMGPHHPPGESFRYSDLSTATLGALVAEITGDPVERFLESRIFVPLGMSDTHTFFAPNVVWAARMNSTYKRGWFGWKRYWDNTKKQAAPFFRASGGIYTTVFDYARFLSVWMDYGKYDGGRILSRSSILEALKETSTANYGCHWSIYNDSTSTKELCSFGHGGSDGTIAIAYPKLDMLFLYFTQSRGTGTLNEFSAAVREIFKP
ncbi:MAG: beta-lactamase family protein [bacterium]|nr:MAG: beta-lactamase family protein [bacterium]